MLLHHALLGLLSRNSMTGYQIKQKFASSIVFFWDAHISQIYRELSGMKKKGWVSCKIQPQNGKPDKKIYSITDTGKKEFLNWLRDCSVPSSETIKSEFLTKIFFADSMDITQLIYQLKNFINKKHHELDTYNDIKKHIPANLNEKICFFGNMTLQRGISCCTADIKWARKCLDDIDKYLKKQVNF